MRRANYEARQKLEHFWSLAHDPKNTHHREWAIQQITREYQQRVYMSRTFLAVIWFVVSACLSSIIWAWVTYPNILTAFLCMIMLVTIIPIAIGGTIWYTKVRLPINEESRKMWEGVQHLNKTSTTTN